MNKNYFIKEKNRIRIDKFLEKKREFRKIYQEAFNNFAYIMFQKEYDNASGSWWLTCIKIDKNNIDINELMLKLKEKGIPARRIFIPASEMPYLNKVSKPCPNAYKIYNQGLCQSSSTLNDEEDIKNAALLIRDTFNY